MQDDLDLYPVAESDDLLEQVPVIDIGPVLEDASAVSACVAVGQISAACQEWGFFQVVNHGVSSQLIEAAWHETRCMFSESPQRKESLLRTRENPWGYYNNELTKNQRDKKEVFDFTTDGIDPIYKSKNRWPENSNSFRQTMCDYRDAMAQLGRTLLEAFCVGLDVPADFMQGDFGSDHTGFVRLNYYPVDDPLRKSIVEKLPVADLGVHHHTDAGALTVLLQDEVGGLQVFKDDRWHGVSSLPGAFVINTGDMMQVWSNDKYKAAIHRVLAMSEKDRYSIPFFFNPSANTEVTPLPGVVSKNRPARYRSVNWSKFRGKRTDGDYADYGPEVQIAQYRI